MSEVTPMTNADAVTASSSQVEEPSPHKRIPIFKLIGVFLAYLFFAWIGQLMAIPELNNEVHLIWPAAGLGLAVLVRGGASYLIPLLLGSWVWGTYFQQNPQLYVVSLGLAYCISGYFAASLLAHMLRRNYALERIWDVFAFLVCGPVLAAMLSSAMGTVALCMTHSLIPWSEFVRIWIAWWLGDAMGVVVIAPFLLVWSAKTTMNWSNRQSFEVLVWLACLIFFGFVVFGNWAPTDTLRYPLELSIFPIIAWAAIRFGQRGATTGVFILAIMALWELLQVLGPDQKYISQSPAFMWVFVGVISTTAYFLSAILMEVRKREEQHARNENRLRAFIDAMPDVAYVISADGYYLDAFGSSEGPLAKSIDRFRNTHVSDNWSDGLTELFQRTIDDTLLELMPQNVEYNLSIAGNNHWFEGRAAPMVNDQGEWDRVIWVAYDITERKQAEAAIEHRDQLIQGVAKANSQLLSVSEKTDAINQALRAIGYSAEVERVLVFKNAADGNEPKFTLSYQWCLSRQNRLDEGNLENVPWESLFPGWYAELSSHSPMQGSVEQFGFAVAKRLRKLGIYSVLMVPISASNEFWGVICLEDRNTHRAWDESEVAALNVTAGSLGAFIENKRGEEALKKAKDSADAANAAKSEFLAMMSHEIRTPMNAILGFTDLLQRTQLDSSQKETLTIIGKSGETLLELINNILDFSKIESRTIELEFHPFKLETTIFEALELMLVKAREKGVDIQYKLHGEGPTCFLGDSHRLRQIILNLVNNAIKFTRKGSIRIETHLSPAEKRDFYNVMIEVIDTGIGIPKTKLSKLFRPFSQVDSSTTRQYGGTGLGLVICKRLIEKMGGEIQVESEEGKGSRFFFTIMLKASASEEKPAGLDADDTLNIEFANNYPLKILLVEDDSVNQQLFLTLLKNLGYQIDLADDDVEAESLLCANVYECVLMDVQLPGKSGLDIISRARAGGYLAENKDAFMVALTAFARPEDRQKCLDAGADEYLSKPVRTGKLKETLATGYKAVNFR